MNQNSNIQEPVQENNESTQNTQYQDLNTDFISFARPVMNHLEEEAVSRVLRSGWLTTGNECFSFEQEFNTYLQDNTQPEEKGIGTCLAVSSATAGLHLSLLAAGIKAGDKVLMSPYTFIASAEVVYYCGAEVVFCDIAEGTYHLDPKKVQKVLASDSSRQIRAVMDVSLGGLSLFAKELRAICDSFGIVLIEDAAHSFPAKENGRMAGTWGHFGVYSFYANKTITSGEGGMIHCESESAAEMIRKIRIHGIDRDMWDRFQSKKQKWQYDIQTLGYKYNMPDLLAAIARVQLHKADEFLEKRQAVVSHYRSALKELDPNMLPPEIAKGQDIHAQHLFLMGWPKNHHYSRETVIEKLTEAGIGTSVHYIPLHCMSFFTKKYSYKPGDFLLAYERYQQVISLPLWPELDFGSLDRIIETIRKIFLLQI
jgi:dTDP-4-amino-4,6-dideoxygalactose transaminase